MGYICLVIDLEAGVAERFSDAMLESGALSVSVEDPLAGTPAEVPLYDEPDWKEDDAAGGWTLYRLRVLFPQDTPDLPGIVAAAADVADMAAVPAFQLEEIPEEDWVRRTQSQFEPIRISDRLWIVPSWHSPPNADAINIALDPGVAFGTGAHPTTRLCLRWLDETIKGGEAVLDYGCGSGILAIAASRLGAGKVAGVDIEASALVAAHDNAAANGVQADFLGAGDMLDFQADILVANILANPLKVLAPVLAGHTRAGGRIALSGILVPQADEVMQVYSPWFSMEAGTNEDGWVCLTGRRLPSDHGRSDDPPAAGADSTLSPASPMITRCTACNTAFRVYENQLAARDGQVRCGHCSAIFNARMNLVSSGPPAASQDDGANRKPDSDSDSAADPVRDHGCQSVSKDQTGKQSGAEADTPIPADLDLSGRAGAEGGLPDNPEEPSETPQDLDSFQRAQPDQSATGNEPQCDIPAEDKAASDAAATTAVVSASVGTPAVQAPLGIAASDSGAAGEFEFVRNRRRAARSGRAAGLGAAVLALTLLLQAGFHFRGDLALLFPQSRQWLQSACNAIGCSLPLPRRSELLSIESSDLQADSHNPSVMILSATLRNKAPFDQVPPALELTLTDMQDRPVARRILTASDYVPRTLRKPESSPPSQDNFPAGTEWPLRIRFNASSLQATGYRLYLFHP